MKFLVPVIYKKKIFKNLDIVLKYLNNLLFICKKLINLVFCKLCGLSFKKQDASKILTNKLIWELVNTILLGITLEKKGQIANKHKYL